MRWLRSVLLSTTAVAGLIAASAAASAADLPVKAPVYTAPAATTARWTGCYVGLQAGYGSTRSTINNSFPGMLGRSDPDFSEIGTIRADGGIIGGQAGCNYQSGMFVVGAEGDLWWSNRTSSIAMPDSVLLISSPGGTTGFNLTMRNRWSGALSLRAGVVVDRALVYGKVGVAATNFHYEAVAVAPFSGVATADTTRAGLLLGVGAEFALTDRWSAKLEYDHVDFGHRSLNLIGSITGSSQFGTVIDPGFVTIGVKERMDLVKVGINYKL
jgi:outer membrane immunogenic protein